MRLPKRQKRPAKPIRILGNPLDHDWRSFVSPLTSSSGEARESAIHEGCQAILQAIQEQGIAHPVAYFKNIARNAISDYFKSLLRTGRYVSGNYSSDDSKAWDEGSDSPAHDDRLECRPQVRRFRRECSRQEHEEDGHGRGIQRPPETRFK